MGDLRREVGSASHVMREMPVIVALMKSSTDHDRFNFVHPYYQAYP